MRVPRLTLAISILVGARLATACQGDKVCPLSLIARLTIPDTTTIKVGASTVAIAGEEYGTCGGEVRPARDYLWLPTDSTIVSAKPLDSIHARIQGLRPGRTLVRVRYRTGVFVSPVDVTVVP
jgi:hypothetical protein